ncbi:MAG: DNA-processing protein DprA [Nitrospirota bacterium]
MEDQLDLIALCAVPDLGPVTIRRLISTFGGPAGVFGASLRELRAVEGVGEVRARSIKSFAGRDEIGAEVQRLMAGGVKIAHYGSRDYPEAIAEMGDDAPLVLYMKGEIIDEDRYAIAMVGSRKSTPYGVTVAERMSAELSEMGFTVVSGLARGIDTAAHRGCLSAGGRTLGVLGSGIDVPYPPENKGLMEKVADSGCVVSEFPPGTPPNRENFPRRNRLISGLSMGVIVVEAGTKSGALITANCALEQGKEVFAVPGNINSAASQGPNGLIKRGAKPVTGAEDVVEELAPVLKGFLRKRRQRPAVEVTEEERALCDAMSGEPTHIDAVSRKCGFSAPKALAILLGLELKGIVKQTEGKRFHLV